MTLRNAHLSFGRIGESTLTIVCLTWFMPLLFLTHGLLSMKPLSTQPPEVFSQSSSRIIEIRALTEISEKIASMMEVGQSAKAKVWPDIDTDFEGRHGIFIACSRPLYPAVNEPGMDQRKSWIMLAVLAAVKYTDGGSVAVDYIAFTDPLGQSGERWYYQLEMKDAIFVQHRLLLGGLSMEQGYNKISAVWRRVTPQG